MTVTSELATATTTTAAASADATFGRLGLGFACLSTKTSKHFALSVEFVVNYSTMALTTIKLGSWDSCQILQKVLKRHLKAYCLHA